MARVQEKSRLPKAVKDFVSKVKDKMKASEITVAELAVRTKLSRQYIYRVLNGEHVPTLAVAELIAKELGLHIATVEVA